MKDYTIKHKNHDTTYLPSMLMDHKNNHMMWF